MRHGSFRAVFEHSWNCLNAQEQNASEQLGVFRGGFSRDAAGSSRRWICSAGAINASLAAGGFPPELRERLRAGHGETLVWLGRYSEAQPMLEAVVKRLLDQ